MTTVSQVGAPTSIPAQAVTIAQALEGMGYATDQFGKNRVGEFSRKKQHTLANNKLWMRSAA